MKLIFYLKILIFTLISLNFSFSQHVVGFEVNSGIQGMQSHPSGLIEVGENLVTIDFKGGNNFSQYDLRVYDKFEGNLLFSEILSSSHDDYFSMTQAIEIDESSDYIFVINKSGFDSSTGQQINSSLVFNYNYDGLKLVNTLSNINTSLIVNYLGDIFLIDSINLNIHKLNTIDYSVLETAPMLFENNNFTHSSVFKLEGAKFLLRGNINRGSQNNDVFLSKLDLTGQVYWENVIEGNRNDYINAATSINGDIYLCGKSLSYEGIFANQYGDGIEWGDEPLKTNWIMKLSANGDLIWNKLLNPSWYQQSNGQFIDIYNGDSFIIVSGSSYNSYDYYTPYDSHYNEDVLSVKLDLDGNLIWEKTYGGFNNQIFRSFGVSNNQIVYTTNLNRWYFAGGATGFASQGQVSAEENGKFNYFSSTNQNDIWVFATNFEGEIQWNQFYGGEKNDNISYSIYNPNAIYCFGATSSNGFDVGELIGDSDSWLFKLEPNSSLSIEDNYISPKIYLHPNPAKNILDINTEDNILILKSILYNDIGQRVFETKKSKFQINFLPTSTYYIEIHTNKGVVLKRFVKD